MSLTEIETDLLLGWETKSLGYWSTLKYIFCRCKDWWSDLSTNIWFGLPSQLNFLGKFLQTKNRYFVNADTLHRKVS